VIEGDDIALRRFAAYAAKRNLHYVRVLGSGKDGVVHAVESKIERLTRRIHREIFGRLRRVTSTGEPT
jgi:hypothetical protein